MARPGLARDSGRGQPPRALAAPVRAAMGALLPLLLGLVATGTPDKPRQESSLPLRFRRLAAAHPSRPFLRDGTALRDTLTFQPTFRSRFNQPSCPSY